MIPVAAQFLIILGISATWAVVFYKAIKRLERREATELEEVSGL